MAYKHVVVTRFGGPEVLEVQTEMRLPEPGHGELRIKVFTAGTGFTDTIIRAGQYPGVKQKPPFTVGYDWVGIVDKLGTGVSGWEPGTMVADMSIIGGYTQYLCVSADRVIPVPLDLDPAEAVCMILSYGTAYQMLTRLQELKPGNSCLVHAAAGAVGSALLELGREMGLRMYGTASAGKHNLVKSFEGIPIDYRSEKFEDRILEDTRGEGVDIVFDAIGAANWRRSYRCLKKDGLLVGYGALQMSTGEERLPSFLWGFAKLAVLWNVLPNRKRSLFYNIQSRRDKKPQEFKDDITTLLQWLKEGRLKPAIAARRPLADARDVHREIDQAQIAGKVVLMCQE